MEREEISKNIPLFFSLVLVSFLLILFDRFGILRPVRGLVESGVNPIKKVVFGAKQSVMGGFSTVSFWRTGTVKIAHLEERVRELSTLSGEVASLREENEKMRRLLGAGLPKAWKFLPALVVGRTEELFIDKGSSEGIEEGMMVISEKVLVGKVKQVSANSSRILMSACRDSKIPVRVVRGGNDVGKGVLEGSAEGRMILKKVLQKEEIKVGDFLVTSGEGDYLPDLMAGEITRVERQEAEVFQQAEVKLLLDYNELGTVFVVKL